ncbi:MAG: ArnT family glycosyltransferase [bacterium]
MIFYILLITISVLYLIILSPLDPNLDEIIYNRSAFTGNLKTLPQLAHHALFHIIEYFTSFITNLFELMPLDGIRFIHIIAFISLIYFIFSIPVRYIKNKSLAFISALIFAVSFDTLEQTMGGEPMFLSLFFLITGYYLIRPAEKPMLKRYIFAGVLFGLSVLTHQLIIPCIMGVLLFLLFMSFRERDRTTPLIVIFLSFLTVLIIGYLLIVWLVADKKNLKDVYLWLTYYGHKQLNIIGFKRLIFLPLAFIRPFFKGQAIADFINYSTVDWRLIPSILCFLSVSVLLIYFAIKLIKGFRKNISTTSEILGYFIMIPMIFETVGVILFMTHNYEYYIVIVAHLMILTPLVFDNDKSILNKRALIIFLFLLIISNTTLEFIPRSRILPMNAPCYHIGGALEKEGIKTGDMVISTFEPRYSMLIEVKSKGKIVPISMNILSKFNNWVVEQTVLDEVSMKIKNVRSRGGRVFLTGEVINPPQPKISVFGYTTYPYGYELGKIWKYDLIETGERFLFQGEYYKIYKFR